jgi:Tol biopolymer transport system component/imidazolonepropionase-like amidohydrolase
MRRHLFVLLTITAVCGALTAGQSGGRETRLSLREGTSIAAALSPDGRTVAIDLLGALWTLDVNGGTATRILDDGYDARMPSWSPDGRRLAFQAYHTSTWDIWTVRADGSGLRPITSGPFDDREPHWSPDGTRLAFSSDRSGSYDIWTVGVETGDVRQLTSNAANDSMPAWSPDGRDIAFVSDREPRGVYRRPADATGNERLLHADARAVWSPSWSPDGRAVAYVAIDGAVSQLVVRGKNIAEASEDVFPFRPQWLSSGELLYTADGVIKRRAATGGASRTVPFTAEVVFTRQPFTPKRRAFPPEGPQRARGLMHPVISPDGHSVAFAALGDLWVAPATGGDVEARRLTSDKSVEANPVWSPDGAQLAFSSDRDGAMGLWVRDMKSGRDRKVTSSGMLPSWSPEGARLAYLDPESQLRVVDVASGEGRQVHDRLFEPGRPSWSPDGRAVVMSALKPYSTRFREGTNQVLRVTVEPDPTAGRRGVTAPDRWFDPLPHGSIGMREDFGPVWSPDGTMMAAIIDGSPAVFPVARDGTPAGPPRRLSSDLAGSPSWTADSRYVLYQTPDRLRLVDVVTGATRDIVPRLIWTPATTTARRVVHAGRLFDGRSTDARTDVDVVIEGNRITNVAPHRAELHTGEVIDASSGTVVPGLIESHAHLSKGYGEVLGRIWLAFGVTTIRNPAASAFEGQEDREAIEAGVRVGPRVIVTGEPLDGSRIYYPGGVALDGGAQIEARLARAEALGFDFIKTYVRLPDLLQKRVIDEAHRRGMPVTSHEIYPALAYGADGVEHIRGTSRRGFSPKMSELRRSYRDVIDLLTASQMTLTPTIGIQGGSQLLTLRDGSWMDDVRIQRMFPPSVTAGPRTFRQKSTAADLAAREALVAPQERMVAEVVRGGGRVIAGTDSPIIPYGLSLLMELEHYVRGGLSPAEAIRTATVVPAEAMGYGDDLGTIERGKLADLVVVDGNPLERITDLRRTRLVVKDGVPYEVAALVADSARPPR